MKKKLVLLVMLVALTTFLAGCTEFSEPIYAESEGFWNQYVVWPLVSLITTFKGLLGTYGLGIVAVTIIIRLVLLPLMIKQTQSSKKMQEIQPELKKLKEKYQSKDAVTQEKYRTEMQKIMTERKINPAAGCLPILIQMPILFGFYHAINRMNYTPEINLGSFLWFELGTPSIILAVLAGLMQFVVLRTGPAMDNPQMKIMMYIMPFMIIIFGSFLPAALSLYWVIGNIISIIQNIFIYKPFKKKEVDTCKSRREKKMKRMTRRGATIEEAISSALQTLGVTRNEVEVEVIDKGKKGFLGFGAKEAEVTVTVKKVDEPSVTEEVAMPLEEDELPLDEGVQNQKDITISSNERLKVENTDSTDVIKKKELNEASDERAIIGTEDYLKMVAAAMGVNDLQISCKVEGKYVTFKLESEKAAILIGKRGQTLNALQQLSQLVANKNAEQFKVVRIDVGDYRERREQSLELLAERMADKAVRAGRKVQLEPMPSYERKVIHNALSNRLDIETYSEGSDPYRYLVIEPMR